MGALGTAAQRAVGWRVRRMVGGMPRGNNCAGQAHGSTAGRAPRIEWRPTLVPLTTDSKRKLGAVRSSGITSLRYACTGVS